MPIRPNLLDDHPDNVSAATFSGDVESYLLDDIAISRPRNHKQKFDRGSRRVAQGMEFTA